MSAGDFAGRATASTSAPSRLEIRVLGSLEIACDGLVADVGGLKARALFARLLIDRGLVVSVDRLVDALWGEHDGEGAEIALRSTMSRLRKRLRDAGAPEYLIVTRAPGYLLDVPAQVTDAHRFEQLVNEGRCNWPAAGPVMPPACSRRRTGSGAGRPTARCGTSPTPGPRPADWRSSGSRPPRRASMPS